MKLRSVVLVELQQSQYAQSILKKRASSGIVHHVGKYNIADNELRLRKILFEKAFKFLINQAYYNNAFI